MCALAALTFSRAAPIAIPHFQFNQYVPNEYQVLPKQYDDQTPQSFLKTIFSRINFPSQGCDFIGEFVIRVACSEGSVKRSRRKSINRIHKTTHTEFNYGGFKYCINCSELQIFFDQKNKQRQAFY